MGGGEKETGWGVGDAGGSEGVCVCWGERGGGGRRESSVRAHSGPHTQKEVVKDS